MRCELLIELSGLTHQEALVIRACAGSPLSFEKVANTLIEHYGSVHLRGGRSLGHQGPSMGSGKGKPSTHKGKGKGRNPWRTGYFAETTSVQDDWEEEFAEDIVEDEEPLVGLLGGADEEEPEEGEYEHEEVEEWESIALNAMADLEGSQDIDASSLGESIRLQIAALAAFGKAKGKKGKGKGKGKVIKSGLTLEQRHAKLQEIKSKSRCVRCGATGQWAGDPACKFPGPGSHRQAMDPHRQC